MKRLSTLTRTQWFVPMVAIAMLVMVTSTAQAQDRHVSAHDPLVGTYAGGKWDGDALEASMEIATVDRAAGTFTGTYAWGNYQPWNVRRGSWEVTGPLEGNTIRFRLTFLRHDFEFTLKEDGVLQGRHRGSTIVLIKG